MSNESDDILKSLRPSFEKKKEDVWADLEKVVEENPAIETKGKVVRLRFAYATAAVLVVLVGATLFMNLYTISVSSPVGEQKSETLPDGSIVQMNAGSEISYQPYWWWANRSVTFEGEAFFEVEKGSKFSVHSENGRTEVLGTSFNINSRNGYQVYCKSGKVRVTDANGLQVILSPGDQVNSSNGSLEKSNGSDETIDWTINKFSFEEENLLDVFDEIELVYDVEITTKGIAQEEYSASFYYHETADETIALVCNTIGATFHKIDERTFEVTLNNH